MSNKKPLLAAVLGNPISHSKSPRMHNYWLKQNKIEGYYIPIKVEDNKLEETIYSLKDMGFSGANVTIPHKVKALDIAHQSSKRAQDIGAANTLTFTEAGSIYADNTDGYGFINNIKSKYTDWIPGNDPKDKPLLGPKDLDALPLEEITIAEKLKSSGYNTFYVGKWHLGSKGSYPEDHGFDINIGGFEKVFELGKIFRNEGIDQTHLPEFTMLESYQAYVDANSVMDMVEDMCVYVFKNLETDTKLHFGENTADFSGPWKRISMFDMVSQKLNIDIQFNSDFKKISKELKKQGVDFEADWSHRSQRF